MILKFLHVFMKPPGDDDSGAGSGGNVDRGDDFTPTEEVQDEAAAAQAAKDAAALEAEAKAAAEKTAATTKDETKAEGETETEAEKRSRKDTRIPRAQHEAILARERAAREDLERRVKAFEGGQVVAKVNEEIAAAEATVAALEKEYAQLMADGKVAEATAKMSEIRRADRAAIEKKAAFDLAASEARAIETVRYNTTLARVEAAYPSLDVDHEDYDKEQAGEVIDLMESFKARGYTPSVSLQRAVRYVMGEPKTAKQETAVETKAQVNDKDVAAERKAAAVKKAAETAAKTPASTATVGMDSDKAGGTVSAKDVMKMRFEDFAKLSDDTLARMRGDELV